MIANIVYAVSMCVYDNDKSWFVFDNVLSNHVTIA